MEAFPAVVNGGETVQLEEEPDTRSRSSSTKTATPSSPSGHKRSLSGNLFSKIPFLRQQSDEKPSKASDSQRNSTSESDQHGESTARNPVLASVFAAQTHGRKRKGSLRKTALLGTGILRMDRRSSDPASPKKTTIKSPTKFSFELPTANSSTESNFSTEKVRLSVETISPPLLTSPVISPTDTVASTTDEDEGLTLPAAATVTLPLRDLKSPSASPSPPSSESSGPLTGNLSRRHSSGKTKSPLAGPQISELTAIEEDWDYSETEWWGWVILVVTWIVFAVGMGSCLEVWSWAWDVGKTPYAPPELEDDPTLPIVGYYPALIILTAVMSWVWVVVAWVGMKYFKHAKIQGDDI